MTRAGIAPILAMLAALLLPVAAGVAEARAEAPPAAIDRRPLFRLDYAPVLITEGDAGPRQLALVMGAQVLRWERLSLGFELDVDAGTTFEGNHAQRDFGALLVGEYDLAVRGNAPAVPFLSAGVGLMHTEIDPDDTSPWSDRTMRTTVAPALMAGIGVDLARSSPGGLHVGLDYLWWKDTGGNGNRLKGNLGGLRFKVGVSVPFSWPGER